MHNASSTRLGRRHGNASEMNAPEQLQAMQSLALAMVSQV